MSNSALVAIRRLLTPWEKDRLPFAFDDPGSYSDTPMKEHLLEKLLHHLVSPHSPMSDDDLVTLVHAFSTNCQKEEWKEYYQPILQKTATTEYTIGSFNAEAPDELRIKPFVPQHQLVIDVVPGFAFPLSMPGPDLGSERMFIYITKDGIEGMTEEFFPWDQPLIEPMNVLTDMDMLPMVIEAYSDGYSITLTDCFPLQMIETLPTVERMKMLSAIHSRCFKDIEQKYPTVVYLGEMWPTEGDEDQLFTMREEFGYSGCLMILKPKSGKYLEPAILLS